MEVGERKLGMDFTAKVLLGIVKQGPVYLRSRRSLEVGEDSDSDSDCEENGDDLLPAFACTLQNVCSTFTEHEVQNGLEESDSCTVNTFCHMLSGKILQWRKDQQHVTLTTIIPTLAVPVYRNKGLHV